MDSIEVSEMLSEKGKPILIANNYKYNFHKVLAGNVKRWQCIRRGCKSYIKTISCNTVVEYNENHNHQDCDVSILNRQKLSNCLKRRAMADIREKPMKLINNELNKKNVDTLTVNDLHLLRKNIYNGRKQVLSKITSSMQEVHDVLDAVKVLTNQDELFLLNNDSVENYVAFSCTSNLIFLSKLQTVYVDGTFNCPKFFYQLYTLHGLQNGHFVPLVFVLLPNKQTNTYATAFNYVKAQCSKVDINFNPEVIYVDFEKSIHSATCQVFPSAELKGCRFHLGQSWFRRIQKLGLSSEYSEDTKVGKYLKSVFGLPFLDPSEVGDCFAINFAEILPNRAAVVEFADYLLKNSIFNKTLQN